MAGIRTEDEPSGVTVALKVSSEASHREHRVSSSGFTRKRLSRDSAQDLQLLKRERARSRRSPVRASEVSQEEKTPRYRRENRECI